MGLKDQRCFRSNRLSDSNRLASLRAFASKLSAESLVALAADDANVFRYIFATFSVSCHVVKLRAIRLLTPMPVVGNETNRTAHVAALESCGEFLLPEGLPASGAGAAGRHGFLLLLPLFICGLRAGIWWGRLFAFPPPPPEEESDTIEHVSRIITTPPARQRTHQW